MGAGMAAGEPQRLTKARVFGRKNQPWRPKPLPLANRR
jgi:hypothetical protein